MALAPQRIPTGGARGPWPGLEETSDELPAFPGMRCDSRSYKVVAMKILVAVKAAAELDDEFEIDESGRDVDSYSVDWGVSEWDRCSLEAAVQLAEVTGESDVVVVSVGDENADGVLLECLARGAHRAIRVWDEDLADCDALAIARVLAEVVRRETPDLVLCGAQSPDAAQSATGVALAGLLDLPRAAVVRSLELEPDSSSVVVGRELEGGTVETLRVPLPSLLTIQTGINEPRYANLRAIKQARSMPQTTFTVADLGIEPTTVSGASGSEVLALHRPCSGGAAEMLVGDAREIAVKIAELVKEGLGT